ncbi:hypothetical protein T4D_10182 [Trichinella pseudospiralis]|uniref:Uncharacterized protein n=1 Tax=Trichinella pseudospiralis TaxID=6337 RepID=A0A0V1FAC7_TRIPS|nr:hypothetical protein T4D_10182 [Trichinella pseudospiralis]
MAAIPGRELLQLGSLRTCNRSATGTATTGGWSGVEAGFYLTKSCPEFFLIQKRPPGDFPLRFLNRVDEAFPVASHPRGSLGNEIPLDAVLDSFHIHVSPELSQL